MAHGLQELELASPLACTSSHGNRDHGEGFEHEALFYSGEEGFLGGVLPFLREGIARAEPALVAVSGARIALLREALGVDAERISFADMGLLGANPARIIPAWSDFLEEHSVAAGPVRGVGEPIWSGRTEAELAECHLHESLLNRAFGDGRAWRLLCPYDVSRLDDEVIATARRTHPYVAEEGTRGHSSPYGELGGDFPGRLAEPASRVRELPFTVSELPRVRATISQAAQTTPLPPERIEDLVLAVSELATNSVRHGGGCGVMTLWREDDELLCQVNDSGHLSEPMAGRARPDDVRTTGRGLWMVNQVCDLVQIRSSPADGCSVRVQMHLS